MLFVDGVSSKMCRRRPRVFVHSAVAMACDVIGWNALIEDDTRTSRLCAVAGIV